MNTSRKTRLNVVVPAHQASATLGDCLDALLSAGFETHEILVVDDGSTDASAEIARSRGISVLSNAAPERPARARNIGVDAVASDIVLFVDADVTVHSDVRERLEQWFSDPSITGVIGSYDETPPSVSVVSRYRNLLHSFTHSQFPGPTPTFWTGLGAVRRKPFLDLGGLDRAWENIEDVEFGLRLTAVGGKIVLDPDIQGTHLKEWTAKSMFRTDLFGRAIPWSKLLLSRRIEIGLLNTSMAHRISAMAVLIAIMSVPLTVIWAPALWIFAAAFVAFLTTNSRFFRYLSRIGGTRFAFAALPYHALHYVAALLGYACVLLFSRDSGNSAGSSRSRG